MVVVRIRFYNSLNVLCLLPNGTSKIEWKGVPSFPTLLYINTIIVQRGVYGYRLHIRFQNILIVFTTINNALLESSGYGFCKCSLFATKSSVFKLSKTIITITFFISCWVNLHHFFTEMETYNGVEMQAIFRPYLCEVRIRELYA